MSHDYKAGPLERGPRGGFTRHSGAPHTIVEHYSWTVPGDGTDMARIAKWHEARNFNGPGYHILVHEDGTREFGRPLWARGAHVGGHNDRTIGVCWLGGRKRGSEDGHDTRTDAQKRELEAIYSELRAQFPSIKRIVGHRDLTATQCPGYDVAAARAKKKQKPAPKDTPPVTRPDPPQNPVSGIRAILAFLRRIFGG